MNKTHVLCREDFSDFPIGAFPYDPDHSAMGEYQTVTPPGYRGRFYDPVCNYTWAGAGPTWLVTETDGVHWMEQMRIQKDNPHRMFPTLLTGSELWRNLCVTVRLRRLSTKGMAGLFFASRTSLDGLVFFLEGRERAVLAHRFKEEVRVLAEAPFPHDTDHVYELSADTDGSRVVCRIDGQTVLAAESPAAARGGRCGITADCPARFTGLTACVTEEEAGRLEERKRQAEQTAAKRQKRHPAMKLAAKISLRDFGTSRQVRFGHLLGDGQWQVVLAQMQRRVQGDAYCRISCLTAVDLKGNVLWQLGEPSPQADINGKVAADVPLQVYDIDGDGFDEVICGWDFEIRILDGRTGAVRKSVKTPLSDDPDEILIGPPYGIYAFDRLNPDGIRLADLKGCGRPTDILIKDRYCRIWAMDADLNVLWKYVSPKNTGHCPLPADINGDGREEVLAGYTMLSADGEEMWSYPIAEDHTDEIAPGCFRGDGKPYFACVSGTQGFFIGDTHGNILMRDGIGHAQRVSVARYKEGSDDFFIAVSNFWGHANIIYMYDADGREVWQKETGTNGIILAPVNWDGSGTELILTNADPQTGGLLDGDGVTAAAFPDDGHPVLCTEAIDLFGDGRDEIVCWDYHEMWIYTQDDGPKETAYHPVKFPAYNASNYRGEYAYPDASFLDMTDREG